MAEANEAQRVLQQWLDETPRYVGDDPRAEHYARNVRVLETAIAALSHPTDAGLVETWQPIETAPKDGRDVLLYYPLDGLSENHPKIIIGFWRINHTYPIMSAWTWQGRGVRGYSDAYQPTYWQALIPPALTPNDDHAGKTS